MEENQVREAIFYQDYFRDFYRQQAPKVQKKIDWTLLLIETNEIVPSKYLKKIVRGLYEVRVEVGNNIFRIFSFFDNNKLVVIINGFQKKTQKVPRKEIDKALKIKKKYYDEKE